MKMRHGILLFALAVEIFLIFYCLFRKSNHVPAGYICAALSLVLLVATGWLLLFPKVTPIETTGEYQVAREDCFYTDTQRLESFADDGSYRELPVSFWYPEDYQDGGNCPLVLFSPGGFGGKESNETLYRELASYGYVVCSIDHTYHAFSTKLSNGKTVRISGAVAKEFVTDNPDKDPEQSAARIASWMDLRADDINFVLDSIIEQAADTDKEMTVYSLIDMERIGVMGHSLGGSAALGIGRQRNDVNAVIALESPFLCDIQGVNDDGSFAFDESSYPVPVLNVYSDASWEHLQEWKQYKINAKMLESESADIQNVHLTGIGHFSLTDLSLTSPFLTMVLDGGCPQETPQETLKKLNEVCLDFFDAELKK
ncbi:MAG: alpha/beta hydrolase family protein [Lachnospiraceae bacterium]